MKRLFLLAVLSLGIAHAQTWPDKPIRVIVPYPPAGPSDIVLRAAAEKMQVVLKQPIVLDNKPGAGGNLGAAEAARAAPDGYTWFWATDNVFTLNPHVYDKPGFKPDDLVPVTIASHFSQTLVCNPALGAKTLKDLIAKAKSEKLNYASGGAGVPGHLAMELLLSAAGVQMQHIPYKGPAPAAQDVIGGQVPCGFLALDGAAGGADRRRSRLPGLRRDLHAGAVRAQGHAAGDRGGDAQGNGRCAEAARRGGKAAAHRPGRGGQHAAAGDRPDRGDVEEVGRGGQAHRARARLITR